MKQNKTWSNRVNSIGTKNWIVNMNVSEYWRDARPSNNPIQQNTNRQKYTDPTRVKNQSKTKPSFQIQKHQSISKASITNKKQ